MPAHVVSLEDLRFYTAVSERPFPVLLQLSAVAANLFTVLTYLPQMYNKFQPDSWSISRDVL